MSQLVLLASSAPAGIDRDYLLQARQMQALSFAVHIPLVCFGIAFPTLVLFVEWLYLRTGDELYRTLAKRWTKVMAALFAAGVVTGTILSFEMRLLWPSFTASFGSVFGPFASLSRAAKRERRAASSSTKSTRIRLTRERRPLTGNSVQIIVLVHGACVQPGHRKSRRLWAERPLLTRAHAAGGRRSARRNPPVPHAAAVSVQEARDAVEARGRRNGAASR